MRSCGHQAAANGACKGPGSRNCPVGQEIKKQMAAAAAAAKAEAKEAKAAKKQKSARFTVSTGSDLAGSARSETLELRQTDYQQRWVPPD